MKHNLCLLGVLLMSACTAEKKPAEVTPSAPAVVKVEVMPVLDAALEREPRFFLSQLDGLAPATVMEIMGTPVLRRKEKEAEVWLYKNNSCAMHLYFYDDENGDLRVDYVETKDHSGLAGRESQAGDFCVTSHLPEPSSD